MTEAVSLIPLGIIHSDAYDYCRQPLMELIEAEWRAGRLTLWGYYKGKNWDKSKPIPYPESLELELDWVAGPSREHSLNPRFPGLNYYCDVAAFHRENPTAYFWTELLIARVNLDRLPAEIPKAALLAFREWRNVTGDPLTGGASIEPIFVGPRQNAGVVLPPRRRSNGVPCSGGTDDATAPRESLRPCAKEFQPQRIENRTPTRSESFRPSATAVRGASEGAMSIPRPRSLSLGEAAHYVADRCAVPVEEAEAALDRAFREYSLHVFCDRSPFEKIQGWQGAKIHWKTSTVAEGEPRVIDGVPYEVRVRVFRQHLDEWIAQALVPAGRSSAISLDDASTRVGKAKFGADWIGKLSERDRWLIRRYVERDQHKPSSIIPDEISYFGPGGAFVPVNDPTLAAEVYRARDRQEQMSDQYNEVFDWLEDQGFDCDCENLDLTRFEHALASAFAADVKRAYPAKSNGGPRKNRRDASIERQLNALGTPPEALPWKRFCDAVRKDCGVTLTTYGYNDRSIQRAVRSIQARPDK